MTRLRTTLVLALPWTGLLGTAPLTAQAVRGQLVDKGNGFPIGGAFVVLLDSAGKEAARVLTGDAGTYLLRAPGPGTYRLQSKRIGFRIAESPPLALADGETVGYRLQVQAVPARLPPVVIEGRPLCGTRGEEGTATAQLWEEAREALAAVRWTAGQRANRYTVERFERDFAEAGGRVLKEQRTSRSGYAETPFRSVPGEELAGRGYVVAGEGDTVDYYAPDAEVLLGDAFVNTHCFTARDGGEERPGLVGLAFQPVPSRTLPDVDGVLWLERNSLELRSLDFKYAKLQWQLPEGALGGHVEFMRIPSGAWIVKHWWIRMAKMGRVVYRDTGRNADPKVLGYREVGGEVVSVSAGTGAVVFSALDAILEGTVADSTRGGLPLPQATVFLEGVPREVMTDQRGQFQIAARLDGEYAVSFRHPRLDSLGVTTETQPVRLARGGRAAVSLAVPPEPRLVARLCPAGLKESERVIVGVVRHPTTRQPVTNAVVQGVWQAVGRMGESFGARELEATTTSDSAGRYTLCGIPSARLTLRASLDGVQGRSVILTLDESGVWVDEKQYRSWPGRIWKQDLESPR